MSINPFILFSNPSRPDTSHLRRISAFSGPGKHQGILVQSGREIAEALKSVKDLDHIPLTPDEIATHSLLNSLPLSELPDLTPIISECHEEIYLRYGANFLGGGFVTGRKGEHRLDGFQNLPNYMVWEWMLQDLFDSIKSKNTEEARVIANLINGIRQLIEFSRDLKEVKGKPDADQLLHSMAIKYSEKIQSLQPGESQLLTGAWQNVGGGSGHAEIYEIVRGDDGSFDIYLYTSTGHNLTESYLFGEREKIKPVILFEGIPEQEFLLNSDGHIRPAFIQSIIEMNVLGFWDLDRVVDHKDVLLTFDFLASYRKNVELEAFGAISGQRAGTCVSSVTKVWARRHSHHIVRYKQIIFHLKFRFLIGAFRTLEKTLSQDTIQGDQARRLMENGAKDLLRRASKALRGKDPLLDQESAHTVLATACDVITRVRACKLEIAAERKAQVAPLLLNRVNFEKQQDTLRLRDLRVPNLSGRPIPTLTLLPDTKIDISDSVDAAIEQTSTLVGPFLPEETVRAQVHHLIDQLPIPEVPEDVRNRKALIQNLADPVLDSIQDKKAALKNLSEILEEYIKLPRDRFSKKFATVATLQACIHYLALKIDDEREHSSSYSRLDTYQFPFFEEFTKTSNQMRALIFFSRDEQVRTAQALKYFAFFKKHCHGGKLFENETDKTRVTKYTVEKSVANGLYWKALLENDPSLKEAIEAEGERHWADWTEQEIDDRFQKDLDEYNEKKKQCERVQKEKDKTRRHIIHPVYPKKHCNLPRSTKWTMILEESLAYDSPQFEDKKHPLQTLEYQHLLILRKTSLLSTLSLKRRLTSVSTTALAARSCRFDGFSTDYSAWVDKKLEEKKRGTQILDSGSVLRTELTPLNHEHQQFLNNPSTSRMVARWNREEREGRSLKFPPENELLKRVLRTLSEWRLTPSQLIHELEANLEDLADPSLQSLIIQLFFRSPVEDGIPQLGCGDLILEDDALVENCKRFIQKGLTLFESKENGLTGGLFFLQLAYHLKKYLVDAAVKTSDPSLKRHYLLRADKLFDQDCINRWLQKNNLTDEQRGQLHFFKTLFLLLKMKTEPESEDLTDLFESWFTYNILPKDRSKISRTLSAIARNEILFFTAEIMKEEINEETLTELCLRLKLINDGDQWSWKQDASALLKGTSKNGTRIILDLVKAKAYTPTGILDGFDGDPVWETSPKFRRLFGDQRGFTYRKEGDGVYSFIHPEHGKIRILTSPEHIFQRQFPGQGQRWFQYSDAFDPKTHGALAFDHAFWIPVGIGEHETFNGFFTTLKKQKIKYASTREGNIIEVDEKGVPKKDFREIYTADDQAVEGLSKMEHQTLVMLLRNPQEGAIEEVRVPRYTSLSCNPLRFVKYNGHLCWSENRQYFLPEKAPHGLLGRFREYQYLVSGKTSLKDKILVPFLPIENGQLGTNTKIAPYKKEQQNEQWEKFTYFVYDIEGNEPAPITLEGQLYLAYLNLAENNFTKAANLLRDIKPTETLSPVSKRILEMITAFQEDEDHADGKAVKLLAAYTLMKSYEKEEKEECLHQNCEHQRIFLLAFNPAIAYLTMLNNVGHDCRLSKKEESYLLKLLLNLNSSEGAIRRAKRIFQRRLQVIDNKEDALPEQPTVLSYAVRGSTPTEIPKPQPLKLPIRPQEPELMELTHPKKRDYPLPQLYTWAVEAYKKNQKENEEKQRKYTQDLRIYEQSLRTARDWLTTGKGFSRYTRPAERETNDANGKLVLEALRRAKSGNRDAIKEMLICLLTWVPSFNRQSKFKKDLDRAIKILRIAPNDGALGRLRVPKKGERLSDEQLIDFIKQLNRLFNRFGSCTRKDVIRKFFKGRPAEDDAIPPPDHFPVENGYFFDSRQRSLEEIAPENIPITIQPKPQQSRWAQLEKWKDTYLVQVESQPLPQSEDPSFEIHPSQLTQEEKMMIDSLHKDLTQAKEDYEAGKKINESIPCYTLSGNTEQFKREVQDTLEAVRELREQKMRLAIAKINVLSKKEQDRLTKQLRLASGVDRKLDFGDLIECLLSGDLRRYILKNPNLTDAKEVNELAALTLEIEDLKSQEAQVLRIAKNIHAIEKYPCKDNPKHGYLCHRLAEELSARYHGFERFDQEVQTALHVFAGETGMIPFKKQVDIIEKMLVTKEEDPSRFRDIVIQLIMGGGKTSVIATIILYLAAKQPGRLSLFIVPSSLYETVKTNLSESMKKAFRTDVLTSDLARADMTPYNLRKTYETITCAMSRGLPVIVKASTLQNIELELLSQARQFSRRKKEIREKKQDLQHINQIIQESEVIIDDLRSADDDRSKILIDQAQRKAKHYKKQREQTSRHLELLKERLDSCRVRIKALHAVATILPKSADSLWDEVDVLLDCLREVNFPDGDTVHIDPIRNLLLHKIYSILIRKDIVVDTLPGKPTIREVVRLEEDKQSKMPKEVFVRHIVPILADQLCKFFKPIADVVSENYGAEYKRYVTGKMEPALQLILDQGHTALTRELIDEFFPQLSSIAEIHIVERDFAFIRYLKELAASDDEKQQEAANLIALSKHFLSAKRGLLATTLQKNGKRNYGTIEGDSSGKIIPYLASHVPATTKFGYHWEEACYNYQLACSSTIDPACVRAFANSLTETARYYCLKDGEKFDETAEFEEFRRIFGVRLDKIHEPQVLETAVRNLKDNPQKRLDLQYELAQQNIAYRTERLSANGITLVNQLDTRRTMSGTPWNVEGYAASLAGNYERDVGTEGRILHKLFVNFEPGKLHEVEFSTIDEFMDPILQRCKTPKRFRGIIETGGLFKIFKSNADAAEQLIHYIEKKQKEGLIDRRIEGVLFFHKNPGQLQPDTLYVWRRGAKKPERIGGSTKEHLKAKGLSSKNTFVFIDERHHTGFDSLQEPDAINIFTWDEKMIRRKASQGAMRLRQLLFAQDLNFALTQDTRKTLLNNGQNLEDMELTSEKTQSFRKTRDMVRYFRQHNDSIFRTRSVKEVLEAIERDGKLGNDFEKTVDRFEPFFVKTLQDEPYKQHGSLMPMVQTKHMLKESLESTLRAFKKHVDDPEITGDVEKAVNAQIKFINQATCLPEYWQDTRNPIGLEQEIAVEEDIAVEYQVEVNLELETELQLELELYESQDTAAILRETDLTEKRLLGMIQRVKDEGDYTGDVIALHDQLTKFSYGCRNKRFHYESIFSEPIFGTDAYFNTTVDRVLPVFHPLQRPPKQILAIRCEDEFRWLLLSEHEADGAKKFLKKLYSEEHPAVQDVWLIQPDGSQLFSGEFNEEFPAYEEAAEAGLLEINAFAGHADYLDKNVAETEAWLSRDSEIKIRFLKLKTARSPRLNEILRRCPVVMQADKSAKAAPSQFLIKARLEKEKNRQGKYFLPPLGTKILSPKKVRNLRVECVKYLGINFDNPDDIDQEAIRQLGGIDKAKAHMRKQFQHLRAYQGPHIVAEQVPWLPESKIKFLEKPEQVYRDGRFYLKKEQIPHLESHQKDLIAFIDPAFYGLFTEKWQIQGVKPEHIDKILPIYWVHLSQEQVKGIPLERADQLDKLQVPEKFGWVHGNLLRAIPKEHRHHISPEQIAEITDRSLIQELETLAEETEGCLHPVKKGQFSSWISPDMVPHIHKEAQLKYLHRQEQISQIPIEWVSCLDPESQVPKISSFQVPGLKGSEQIQKCPDSLVRYLDKEQISHVAEGQIPLLRGEQQIQSLQEKRLFQFLKAEPSHDGKHENQMRWISTEQLSYLLKDQLKGLNNKQLLALRRLKSDEEWKDFGSAMTQEQITSFHSQELIALLTKEQITRHLSSKQVKYLTTKSEIRACPINLARHLRKRQLKKIAPEQIPGLTYRQLVELHKIVTKDQWNLLREHITAEQIQSFTLKSHLDLISLEQITASITSSQVHLLDTGERIRACPLREEHIQRLGAEQIQEVTADQAKLLSPEQVGWLERAEDIDKLALEQYPFLNDRAILNLTAAQRQAIIDNEVCHDLIPRLRPNWVVEIVSPRAFLHVTEEQIDNIDEHEINALNDNHPLWGRVTPAVAQKVDRAHVKHISTPLIAHIRKQDAIRALPFMKVQHLTRNQLKERSAGQFIAYMIGVILLGVVSSIAAFVAHMSLVPLIIFLANRETGRKIMAKIHENPVRLYRFFAVYAN